MKKFFLLMLSVFAFCAADAQVTTSGMNGTVTDADGQPLAGATVIAVHTPSGTQYGAVSDKNGGYNLQGLRTGGPYTVTFSFVGCQSVEFPGLMLSLGQTLKRDAFLKDSQQLEAVVITADGKNSSMNVNRAGAVTSISNEQIELMPTVNRSMNDIMRLTPQASSTTSGLAIGGGNYRQSYVTVDGAAFNNMFGIGGNLPAGGSPISLDALDLKLPGDVNLNIEGIYNKDFNSVTVTKLGMVEKEGGIRLPGEPEARTYWESGNIRNKDGETVNPYLINNTDDVDGYYASVSAQVSKTWGFGLSLTAAYTYSSAKNVIDGIGDQVTSAFSTNTFNKNGSNVPELGYASYVSPHRILLNVGYRLAHKSGASNFGLYYEAFRQGYIGSYSYSRYSYTMYVQSGKYQNPVTNDRGAVNLIYIPTREELDGMPFTSDENREEYWKFIRNDDYLSKHTGEYSKRGGAVMPWQHMLNFRFSQDFYVNVKGRRNTISLGLDVNNIANMLNRDWGNVKRISTTNILKYENGAYTFNKPTWSKYAGTISTWSAMFSIRYTFN